MDKITSSLYNIDRIVKDNLIFQIPRYQRLYVWQDMQVKSLFYDLHTAATTGKDIYYLGGVILVKNKENQTIYDLVDGQQRFTTLWLLAYELGDHLSGFRQIGKELRLRFAIREKVSRYFNDLTEQLPYNNEPNKEFEDLKQIDFARRRLRGLVKDNLPTDDKKRLFASFLLEQLMFVVTVVPQEMNLNKLFETLNNRGEQLSQDEILKSRILQFISVNTKRQRYAHVWNACSDMDSYFEKALSQEAGWGYARYVADSFDHHGHTFNPKTLVTLFENKKNHQREELHLQSIIKRNFKSNKDDDGAVESREKQIDVHPEAKDNELQNVRSILSFSQFILHVLRVFRHKKKWKDINRINDKELLEIFNDYFIANLKSSACAEELAIEFLDLLIRLRTVFDKYIVKWVEIDKNTEELLIKKVYKQNRVYGSSVYYIRREETSEYNGLVQLQRILYHSQQSTTQYWLTPYLSWLLDHNPVFDEAYKLLKKLDSALFCTNREREFLIERTWECMTDVPEYLVDYSILEEVRGTGFPHYWLYKVDFVLWHERNELAKQKDWENYKFTAKNSIEHIGPQNPGDKRDKVCLSYLDKMGNIVLVTRGINSEYGDDPFKMKKARFENKKIKGQLDSLKSDLIYSSYEIWNDNNARLHQEEILKIMETYFNKTR